MTTPVTLTDHVRQAIDNHQAQRDAAKAVAAEIAEKREIERLEGQANGAGR